MATKVLKENEIVLNGVRLPIVGKVQPSLVSPFPGKIVTGDVTKDDEPLASNWTIVSDLRGGIGAEEMDEATQAQRYWFGTAETRFNGHLCLPPLATSVMPTGAATLSAITAPTTPVMADWAVSYATTHLYADDPTTGIGRVVHINATGSPYTGSAYVQIHSGTGSVGHTYKFSVNVKCSSANVAFIRLGYNSTYYGTGLGGSIASYHTGSGDYEKLTVYLQSWKESIIYAVVGVVTAGNTTSYVYFDSTSVSITEVTYPNKYVFGQYNTTGYCAYGRTLYSGGKSGWTKVADYNGTITALVPCSVDQRIHVLQGDGAYYYLTPGSYVETGVDNGFGINGVEWDSKLFVGQTDGQIWYTASPWASSPIYTKTGKLLYGGDVDYNLIVSRDASSDTQVYVGCRYGVKVLDFDTAQLLDTELILPNHPTGCKGMTIFRDSLFVSAGIDVMKYSVGSSAVISAVGLSKDDGIPVEYNGQIVNMTKDFNFVYAAIDSTYGDGTTKSWIATYNEAGWSVLWEAGVANKAMGDMFVSSAGTDYCLWFVHNSTVYYIDLQRTLTNPLKLSTSNFASSAFLVSPIFDANYNVGNKTAIRVNVCTKGCDANKTVALSYRIDRPTSAIANSWTSIGTITTNGITTFTFGSGAGINYKAIQFRIDLVSNSATVTPDIPYVTFVFLKSPITTWGYRVTVDATQDYQGITARQIISALKVATASTTLVDFTFNDNRDSIDTYYVQVRSCIGQEQTGRDNLGTYVLFLTGV